MNEEGQRHCLEYCFNQSPVSNLSTKNVEYSHIKTHILVVGIRISRSIRCAAEIRWFLRAHISLRPVCVRCILLDTGARLVLYLAGKSNLIPPGYPLHLKKAQYPHLVFNFQDL